MQAESERGWKSLVGDVEAALANGVSPDSDTALRLTECREALFKLFTGGDPGIEGNLQKLYADEANWPATFKRPFSDAVNRFWQAADGLKKIIKT